MHDVRADTKSAYPGFLQSLIRATTRRLALGTNVTAGVGLRVGRSTVVWAPHHLSIGDDVSIGPGSVIQCDGYIGDFVLIGMGVQIVGRDDHAVREIGIPMKDSTWVGDRARTERDAVHIGRDVWVGGASVVLSGVSLGEGSIIGSGSVVTHDVDPYAIVAGNPARFIRWRFESLDDRAEHSRRLYARSRPSSAA